MQVKDIPIESVLSFSKRDKNYLLDAQQFNDFLAYPFEYSEFKRVIENRKKNPVDRDLLHSVILEQYKNLESSSQTQNHIQNIKSDDCYTIATAHQPSLMTGPLYYVYKILSTIKLCQKLSKDYPTQKFAPVFVIGGEDHDFEEINHLYLFNKKIEWKGQNKGPVGRIPILGIPEIIQEVKEILGPQSKAADLLAILASKANNCETYGEFAFQLTHTLFDHLGLVILRMDSKSLKSAFIPIIKDEIFNGLSKPLVEREQERLESFGYKNQAYARDINFFYLNESGRNRIEKTGNKFTVIDTDISFSKEEIENEIDNHPGRFSPNVVMRPLYQELILPNLAYIGGGGELAYWMERKTQFEHFNIPFPMLIRRNSAMIVSRQQEVQLEKLGFTIEDIFNDELMLIQSFIDNSDNPDFSLEVSQKNLEDIYKEVEKITKSIDSTLVKTVQSELAKSKKSLDYLESKMKKSVKQKEEVQLNRIKKLKQKLFPNGLQERHDNIFEYLSKYGQSLIDDMLDHCDPFDKKFKVFVKD